MAFLARLRSSFSKYDSPRVFQISGSDLIFLCLRRELEGHYRLVDSPLLIKQHARMNGFLRNDHPCSVAKSMQAHSIVRMI